MKLSDLAYCGKGLSKMLKVFLSRVYVALGLGYSHCLKGILIVRTEIRFTTLFKVRVWYVSIEFRILYSVYRTTSIVYYVSLNISSNV